MVKGINQFKAHFGDFNDRYVLIGGVACFLSLDEAGLDFRVTKDLDIDGIPTVPPEIIIPLKARAWLDLTERRDAGEKVDDHDIKKHKNDIFRLFQVIDPGIRITLPEVIKNDMQRYIWAVIADPPQNLKQLGLGGIKFDEITELLQTIYGLSS